MVITRFPDPRRSTEEGIVAVGGDLEPESLILAYSKGIFPWPIEGLPLPWFCPPQRGVLEYEHFHISRSLARFRKKDPFQYSFDRAFGRVIRECVHIPRPGHPGTWITAEMIEAYTALHQLGFAHSVEVWKGSDLVGGLYGVESKGVFSAESMFHHETNASKLAIVYLMEHLHQRGLDWIDIQVISPHLQAMGAREISRDEFLNRLEQSQQGDFISTRLHKAFGPDQ